MDGYGQAKDLLGILMMLVVITRASRLDETSTFINSLSDSTKYDKRLRPYHREATVNVTVGMTIFSFGEIDELEGEFSLGIFFHQEWIDPRLRHNNSGEVILSGVHTDLIWLPDTFFINLKKAKAHDVPSRTTDVKIKPNGKVRYSKRITLSAGCEIDLHRYPLDSQECRLRIMSYAYEKQELDYHWKGDIKQDIGVMNDQMAQLIVTDMQRIKTTVEFGRVQFSELAASFEFKRRLGYALLQVYAPTFLIVTLSWLSFWISKNAVPARIALGITTLLTIVTLNGSFRSTVPKVSYMKALDLYLVVSFFFVFGAILEYIVVLLHHDYSLQFRKIKAKKDDKVREENTENAFQMVEKPFESAQNSSKSAKNSAEAPSNQSSPSSPTKNTSKAMDFINNVMSVNSTPIDKISKFAFPISFFLFNVVYWIFYTV